MSGGQQKNNGFADGYIDVATRIAEIRGDAERHYPDGRFQPADIATPFQVVTVDGTTYIAYVAAFYRDADDKRPGIGSAWEQVPGRTAFTRGSELQNAETSAWGRALVAALAADTRKGVASADEVRNRQAERDAPSRETDFMWLEDVRARLVRCGSPGDVRGLVAEATQVYAENRLSTEDAKQLRKEMDERIAELKGDAA